MTVVRLFLFLRSRRTLSGHYGKVYAMMWCPTKDTESVLKNQLVSASQDGNLFIWDALEVWKLNQVNLKSPWVLSVGYSHSGQFVCSGGLDNTISIYRVEDEIELGPNAHSLLRAHDGYITSCSFLSNDTEMLTSSGDKLIILWDIKKQKPIREFRGHAEDVMWYDCGVLFIAAPGTQAHNVSGALSPKPGVFIPF